ncbi:MobC family plasmid mobilization relaxosome protein [Streptomyces sp. Tu6071]|uniref:MobC family plasmid mobilization relaxosome protein n=1 Tax=Streptomyces sp. Tu6071 TaxID=355249 RepID=UPI00031668CA|nr:MobC family plasmid mobilization relaxosome protein [Streptomyces sp. Tu6071]
MTSPDGEAATGQDTATGRASYTVRPSYGRTNGAPAQEGGGGPSGSRTRAPGNPTDRDRHQGAPVPETDKPATPPRAPRRRPRNHAPRQRTRKVTTRLAETEHEEILAAARRRAVTTARFLAAAGLAAARGTTALEPHEKRDTVIDELALTRAQLARVGNNLNQLTRATHLGIAPHPDDLAHTLDRLRRVLASIDDAATALAKRRSA